MAKPGHAASVEEDPVARVRANHDEYLGILQVAVDHVERGRVEDGCVALAVAARLAWIRHAGFHAGELIEGTIGALAGRLGHDGAVRPVRSGPPRTVLHILTEAFQVGGHTRLATRWIAADSRRSHSVLLTRQGPRPVPPGLVRAVEGSGGTVMSLRPEPMIPLAAHLRAYAREFDLVVLHVHPNDVAVGIALAVPELRPPTILMNHADHSFWLGVGWCEVVANVRQSGASLCVARRGVRGDRVRILPIALAEERRRSSREEAKRLLGLDPGLPFALSVAAPHKYARLPGIDAPSLPELLAAAPADAPFEGRAIGPAEDGPWRELRDATGGRVRALGIVVDPSAYEDACDVYLDSAPIGSLTSALEAAARGAPVISARVLDPDAAVLMTDLPGLDDLIVHAGAGEYGERLAALLGDEARRDRVGAAVSAAVSATCRGEPWLERLEALYAHAVQAHRDGGTSGSPPGEDVPSVGPLDRALAAMYQG